jgi:hypothetical protein
MSQDRSRDPRVWAADRFLELLAREGIRLNPSDVRNRQDDGALALRRHIEAMENREGIELCFWSFMHLRGVRPSLESDIQELLMNLEDWTPGLPLGDIPEAKR